MKNANKAETSREAKALSVVAKVEKKSRAKGKPNAATVESVNGLSGETIALDVGDRISQFFCRTTGMISLANFDSSGLATGTYIGIG